MDQLIAQLQFSVTIIQQNLPTLLGLLGIIWVINGINWVLGNPLFLFGISPRRAWGLIGIFFSPWLHANFNHLFYNSIPLILLASGALITGWDNFLLISAIIIIVSGILIWLGGRPGVHIGASALIMGYWAYLLALSFWLESGVALLVGFIALYYFGGLVANLFPSEDRVSWEGHVYGFMAGILAAWWVFAGQSEYTAWW